MDDIVVYGYVARGFGARDVTGIRRPIARDVPTRWYCVDGGVVPPRVYELATAVEKRASLPGGRRRPRVIEIYRPPIVIVMSVAYPTPFRLSFSPRCTLRYNYRRRTPLLTLRRRSPTNTLPTSSFFPLLF